MTATVTNATPTVALVTIDRPPVNALDAAAYEAAASALQRAGDDPTVGAIVLAGAGSRAFSAGTDLSALEDGESYGPTADSALRFFETLAQSPKPIVGAVNGPAVGAGAMIAAECDVLVAVKGSYFSIPELTRGYVGAGSHIKRLAPYFKTIRMMLLGERLTAAEAGRLGTVARVVARERLLEVAVEIGERLAALNPGAVREARSIFRRPEGELALEGYRAELDTMRAMIGAEGALQPRCADGRQ